LVQRKREARDIYPEEGDQGACREKGQTQSSSINNQKQQRRLKSARLQEKKRSQAYRAWRQKGVFSPQKDPGAILKEYLIKAKKSIGQRAGQAGNPLSHDCSKSPETVSGDFARERIGHEKGPRGQTASVVSRRSVVKKGKARGGLEKITRKGGGKNVIEDSAKGDSFLKKQRPLEEKRPKKDLPEIP